MAFTTSLSVFDGVMKQKSSYQRNLSEIEILTLDSKHVNGLAAQLSENNYKTINLPLRSNNFEITSISYVVYLRNSITGNIFAHSLDQQIQLPRSPNPIMVENMLLHPLPCTGDIVANFI